jgi:organic hydroperoxide reductase OsmC/OhrA
LVINAGSLPVPLFLRIIIENSAKHDSSGAGNRLVSHLPAFSFDKKKTMNPKQLFACAITLCLLPVFAASQDLTQNIRGKVVEKETKSEIIGANVFLTSDTTKKISAM